MSFFRDLLDSVQEILHVPIKVTLSNFQTKKLLHEFSTFYDVNGDGSLQWKDFEIAHQKMCKLNGWQQDSEQAVFILNMFKDMWISITYAGDENQDGEISAAEWLNIWTNIIKSLKEARRKNLKRIRNMAAAAAADPDNHATDLDLLLMCTDIPGWVDQYLTYKFNVFDRTGDGEIDKDEYEYVLTSLYNISIKDCRTAFTIISQNGEKPLTKAYFRELTLQYFISDDPGQIGNYINGRLLYD